MKIHPSFSLFRLRPHTLSVILLGLFLPAAFALAPRVAVQAARYAQQGWLSAAVANDDFDNALSIDALPFSHQQDIITATTAPDDPLIPCTSGQRYNTVWYRLTPSDSEELVFSTAGSQYSMVLAVWSGARGSLVNQGCTTTTQLSLSVAAGTTYHIEVARDADYIIPSPSTINIALGVWPADTQPGAFSKLSPPNGDAFQPTRPTLFWESSSFAANYAYCVDSIDNDDCDTSWIAINKTSVELSGLSLGTSYYWQARAGNTAGEVDADGGAWWTFSTAAADNLNPWNGIVSGSSRTVAFDVLTDAARWLNFKLQVPYAGCNSSGTSTITVAGPGTITNRSFSYHNQTGSLSFSGTFNSNTTATGSYNLNGYGVCVWIASPGYCCWAATYGSGLWTAGGPPLAPIQQLYLPAVIRW